VVKLLLFPKCLAHVDSLLTNMSSVGYGKENNVTPNNANKWLFFLSKIGILPTCSNDQLTLLQFLFISM
jgi:hypothetical protein